MKKTYQLKTNALKGEQQVIDVTPALGKAPTRLSAAGGARYELIDPATKSAPDNIRVRRKANDLEVFFEGDSEAGLVIEDFYKVHTDHLPTLVGKTEQGALYEYIPESASPTAVVTQLGVTGNSYGMALGGQELAASGAAVGLLAAPLLAGFSPLLLGAGVLGAAALAGGGGGSSNSGGTAAIKPNDGQALGLSIGLDTDNNGFINQTEKGAATNTSVTATFDPSKVAAGQELTLSDGSKTVKHTLTATDVTAGRVTINDWALPGEGQSLTVKATLTDGKDTTPEASDTAILDTQAPNDGQSVGLRVDLDNNADGFINGSEKGLAAVTSLTATFDPGKVKVGDKLTFSDGTNSKEIVLTAQDVAAGKVSSAGWTLPQEDASQTYSVVLKDTAGNATTPAQQSITLDAVTESLKTALSLDPISRDNILSVDEQKASTVRVTGKVTGTFLTDDVVTLSLNNKSFTGKAGQDGSFSIEVPTADLAADGDAQIEASVTGGRMGQLATAAQHYVLETAASAGKNTALLLDPITSDNLINIAEAADPDTTSIPVTGRVTGQFAAGDTVTLLVNSQTFKGVVDANGAYSIPVLKTHLLADADTTVDASVSGTGGSSAKGLQNYGVDTTMVKTIGLSIDLDAASQSRYGNDGYINKGEKGTATETSLTASFDASKVSAGDTVVFSDDTHSKEIVLTADNVAQGKITSTGWALPNEDKTMKVTAILKDPSGNTSDLANDSAKLDFTAATVKVETAQTNAELARLAFTPNESGTFELHIGDAVFSASSPNGLEIDKTVKANEIFFKHWDSAGNLSTTYLIDETSTTLYTVTPNTIFQV